MNFMKILPRSRSVLLLLIFFWTTLQSSSHGINNDSELDQNQLQTTSSRPKNKTMTNNMNDQNLIYVHKRQKQQQLSVLPSRRTRPHAALKMYRRQRKDRKINSDRCVHHKCQCRRRRKSGVEAVCDRIFRTLPRFHQSPIVFDNVFLRMNNFSSLPASHFTGNKIVNLHLGGNNFIDQQINPLAFEGQETTLISLWMNDCHLEEVPTVSTSRLEQLQFLHLEGNEIASIDARAFENNGELKELHLYENRITSINQMAFSGLGNLQILVLCRNQIKALSPEVFEPLKNLTVLDLSSNLLEYIGSGLFAGMRNLELLRLDSNRISKLETHSFKGISQLSNLKLDYNPLALMENDVFKNVPRLNYLSIELANLTSVNLQAFSGLTKVNTLSLGELPPMCNNDGAANDSLDQLDATMSPNDTLFDLKSSTPSNDSKSLPSGAGILSSARSLKRLSVTDYSGRFTGIWKSMLSSQLAYSNLSVFVAPMRKCRCLETWIKELVWLGAYVHGFCLDGTPLSCVKSDIPPDEEQDPDYQNTSFYFSHHKRSSSFQKVFSKSNASFFARRSIKAKT